jgi:hypothetical protein
MKHTSGCCGVRAAAVIALAVALYTPRVFAQQSYIHLNPMIEKLAQGKPVVGITTADFSMENAHAIARSDVDFVRIEMEHGPMDFEALRNFLIGMIDKAAIVRKGNGQSRASHPTDGSSRRGW